MSKTSLIVGITGTLAAAALIYESQTLDAELDALSSQTSPKEYVQYQQIQNSLNDYALNDYSLESLTLAKMDSARAKTMVDEINTGLKKRYDLIHKRDSLTANYDIAKYDSLCKKRISQSNLKLDFSVYYTLGAIIASACGVMSLGQSIRQYQDNRRRRRMKK